MKTKKILTTLLLSLSYLGGLVSCGGGKKSSTTPQPTTPVTSSTTTPTTSTQKPSTSTPSTSTPVIDPHTYMLVGSGLGAGGKLSWALAGPTGSPDPAVKFVQDGNTYTLTEVTLYKDDQIKVAASTSWDDGSYGYYNCAVGTKDVLFENIDGGNMKVVKNGVYTITLTSNGTSVTSISAEWIRDAAPLEVVISYAVKGSQWGTGWPILEENTFEESEVTPGVYTLELEIETGTVFGIQRLKNGASTDYFGWSSVSGQDGDDACFALKAGSSDISCSVGGTYLITIDTTGDNLTITFEAAE